MKKISLILVLCILVSCMPVYANADSHAEITKENLLIQTLKAKGLDTYIVKIRAFIVLLTELNPEEKKLILKHPIQAYKVYKVAKVAEAKTIEFYGKSEWSDNSDAFRHCLWNALMAKSIGTSCAQRWATAYEFESMGIDKDMDLYNNQVGRNLDVADQPIGRIVALVKQQIKQGACKRIVDGKLVPTNGEGMTEN